VGWMIAETETSALGQRLIEESYRRQDIQPGQITIHSDRGAQMRALTMAQMCGKMGIEQSFNRPHTSNDNPFSEAQFKTLKYNPWYPGKFGSIDEATAFGQNFFPWYNDEHHHGGLAFLSPATVHYGRIEEVLRVRDDALAAAFAKNPERFVNGPPRAKRPPTEVYINPPLEKQADGKPPKVNTGENTEKGRADKDVQADTSPSLAAFESSGVPIH
jgi:putative transposase